MPRKYTVRDFKPDTYYHIFNEGANEYPLFHDDQDFDTFLGFIQNYLTPRPEKEDLKVTVEFQGKKLTGVPRQPNNFYGDLQLLVYCVNPLQFHLVMYQDSTHAIAKFMQSLITRYSMYFNRRHNRTGSPFRGKYKAMELTNFADILPLSHYLHRKSFTPPSRSSYPIYLNQQPAGHVTTQPLLDFFTFTHSSHDPHQLLQNFTDDTRIDYAAQLGELRLDV